MGRENKILSLKDYVWEWDRKVYPYYLLIFSEQWRYNKFCPPVYSLFLYENEKVSCYLDKNTLNKSADNILNNVDKDSSFQKRWEKFEYKTAKNLHRFCDTIEKINLKKLSNSELLRVYLNGYQIYSEHDLGVGIIRNVNRKLQDRLMDLYRESATVAALLSTNKESFFTKEHKNLFKIADLIKKKKISKARKEMLIKNHVKKYFYLPCGYYGDQIFLEEDFKSRIKEILKSKETFVSLKRKEKANLGARTNLLKRLNPDAQTKRIIKFGSLCTYFKDFIRGNLNRLHYYNTLIFKEIGRRTGNDWEDVASLVPQEMQKFISQKRRIKRKTRGLIYSDKKGIHFYFNKKVDREIRRIKEFFSIKKARIINGIVANVGKAQGRILIVKDLKDAIGKKNYVLASVMTTPDLMPAIKKAKAVITDEGGLTCHAAIISRELGKPCIIGTKIATKVLKDGDLVEVDADKGFVRIIKKK